MWHLQVNHNYNNGNKKYHKIDYYGCVPTLPAGMDVLPLLADIRHFLDIESWVVF